MVLARTIEVKGRLNLLDINVHSENFFRDLLNLIYFANYQNLNHLNQNNPGVDLIDNVNKIVLQVSATCTKDKIEHSLATVQMPKYNGFNFKFLSISNPIAPLKKKSYCVPANLAFDPKVDILDVGDLIRVIQNLQVDQIQEVLKFLHNSISNPYPSPSFDTNLAKVITLISKQDWANVSLDAGPPFDISEKMEYNNFDKAITTIKDLSIYFLRIEKIYSEFDVLGSNKSVSVVSYIRSVYRSVNAKSSDDHFDEVVNNIKEICKRDASFETIPEDELQLCAEILVVDAFVKCKIFKRPPGNVAVR